MYRTNWGIGHGLKDILEACEGSFTSQGHKGLYEILTTSWHAQLSLNLAMLGSLTIVVAHHILWYIISLFTHHMWIGRFLIVGVVVFYLFVLNLGFCFPLSTWYHVFLGLSRYVWSSISDQGIVTHITGGNFVQSSITNNGPIAHAIWDPYFGQLAVEAFTQGGDLGLVNIAYSSVYQWWYIINLRTNEDLYTRAIFLLFLSAISLIEDCSLAWITHLVHVAIPRSRGKYARWNNFLDVLLYPQRLGPFFTGHIKDLLDVHIPSEGRLGCGQKGLYDIINNSLHFQLGLALVYLGVFTTLVAQHMYYFPTYAFIAQ
ncbi:hypothetical protein Pfo_027297 [Paulownia fortunei]|nr:hypothetical protein Pfo_027297 [Paulownia fortunei]